MKTKAIVLIIDLVLLLIPFKLYSQEQPYSPYHVKAQFAGNLGFISVGAGRGFIKEKLETDIFLGYLPKKIGGDRIFTTALKATYVPLVPIQVRSLEWQPLRAGMQLSYTFGKEYFVLEHHDKYSKGYYGFPTALHLYIFAGGQVNFSDIEKLSRFGAYYEFGSNAEYLISYMQNPKYLSPGKVFNLALGVRMKL